MQLVEQVRVTAGAPEWLVIGGPVVDVGSPGKGPAGVPLADFYVDLIRRFGPGTFNDFVHLSPPAHLGTYAERLDMPDDPVLARHVVFADSDNGDALSWDLSPEAKSPVYRFAPRSFEPDDEPIAKDADGLLFRLAERNLVFDRGPLRPFFVPSRPRARWDARAPGRGPTKRAVDTWLRTAREEGIAALLARTTARDHLSLTLHLSACDAIARLQHVGKSDGFWQLAFDAPKATRKPAFDAFLGSAAAIGLDAPIRAAFAKAKKTTA